MQKIYFQTHLMVAISYTIIASAFLLLGIHYGHRLGWREGYDQAIEDNFAIEPIELRET